MNFKFLILFIFLLPMSLHAECEGNIPTTVDGRFQDLEEVFSSPALFNVRTEYCRAHENQFREYVLGRLGSKITGWQENRSNPQVLSTIETQLRQVHSEIEVEHQQHANNWFNSLLEHEREFAKNCFIDYDKQEERPYIFHFDGHYRTLATRNDLSYSICVGPKHQWQAYLTQNVNEADSAREFRSSPFGRIMDQSVIFGADYTQEEYDRVVPAQIERGIAQMTQLREHLTGLPDRALYDLYDFQNLYENEFLPTLDESQRTNFFPTCRENSTWGASCVDNPITIEADRDLVRCASRTLNFLGENLPLLGMIDGLFVQPARTNTAHKAGLITDEENSSLQGEHAIEALFAIPIILGSGSIIRATSPHLLTKVVRPTFFNELNTPAGRTLTINRAVSPVGTSSPLSVRVNANTITHLREHDFNPREVTNVLSERMERIRTILNTSKLSKGARENRIAAILIEPLEDGRPSPFRVGSNDTTVYPEGMGLEDVLPLIERGQVRQEVRGRSVINTLTLQGRQYRFRVDEDGNLSNFYPLCGRGIFSYPRRKALVDHIIDKAESIALPGSSVDLNSLRIPHPDCR
jgi:hypothetical protein